MKLITYPQTRVDSLVSQGFSRKTLYRFWRKIRITEQCWMWTGCCDACGYGRVHVERGGLKVTKASRLSWMIHFGPIPNGMHVLHKCDNPPCVNPNHLWLGTHKDNMDDRDRKGRVRHGETAGMAKLTRAQVREIKERLKHREFQTHIARQYGVSPHAIWQIANNLTWKTRSE